MMSFVFPPPPPPSRTFFSESPSPFPLTLSNRKSALREISKSGASQLTLTALGVGVGLGCFFALLAMCLFALIRRRRNKNRLDEFPSKLAMVYEPAKPLASPDAAEKTQLRPISSFVIPISTRDDGGSEKPPIATTGDDSPENSVPGKSIAFSNMTFSYEELATATDNFSCANYLGQGGFGYVHKGVLPNGKEVAVKQLKSGSGQGEREFQAEVDTISRVQHKHLVSLVGYCICGDQRLLVYEFVPNQTLEFHLHGEGKRPPLRWCTRLKIALGAARGLAYLHEECHPKIIHRDIKASNILLDDNFEAKVADFGLAKFSYDNDTHVSTRVMGTFGYMAPEYASSGKLSEKSDVFSFGVVLLELITGRRPIDKGHCFMDDSMVEWARPLLREALETGKFDGLVDPKLEEYNAAGMAQMVACAAACVRQSARRRPRTSQIVQALEGSLPIDNLCDEMSPASTTICGSSDYEQYKENLKRFKKLALESQELSTSGCSAVTSNIGAAPSVSSTENQSESKNDDEDVLEIPIL